MKEEIPVENLGSLGYCSSVSKWEKNRFFQHDLEAVLDPPPKRSFAPYSFDENSLITCP